MCFSSPVFFDDGVDMFIAGGKPVRQFHIDAIRDWNVTKLVTYGHAIDKDENAESEAELEELEEIDEIEELEGLEEIEDNTLDYQFSQPVYTLLTNYNTAIKNMEDAFVKLKRGIGFSRGEIEKTADILFAMVKKEGYGSVSFILNRASGGGFAACAVNTAVMSGTVAVNMDMSDRKILQIITSALLHDIYMVFVPEEILNKKGKLTSSEFDLLKMHTVRGASYLIDRLLFPREIGDAVKYHHEFFNGQGYPEGRSREDIPVEARIISVCDSFEAMISEKPYRNAVIGYEAVKNLLRMAGTQFDPVVVQNLIKSMGVYPAGTFVLLSNISVARVMDVNVDSLFLPVIKIVEKGKGSLEAGTVINLKEDTSSFIIRPLSKEEAARFA